MKKRIITGIILGLVFIPAIIFGCIYYLILSMFLVGVGTYELMNMFYTKDKTLKNMRFIVPVFSVILDFLFYQFENYGDTYHFLLSGESIVFVSEGSSNLFMMYGGLIIGAFLLFIIIIMLVSIMIKDTGAHFITSCIISMVYGGLMLSSALAIEYVKPIGYEDGKIWGGQLFAYLYVVVAFTDMFAYFIGIKFGRHKLCPSISPKKSVEGAIGGLVFGSIFGVLALRLFKVMPINHDSSASHIVSCVLIGLFISMLISIVVQFGDLVASKLKRTYGIKDYGNIFPGHGGVMDRFDSLILSGSFLYVLIMVVKLIFIGAM